MGYDPKEPEELLPPAIGVSYEANSVQQSGRGGRDSHETESSTDSRDLSNETRKRRARRLLATLRIEDGSTSVSQDDAGADGVSISQDDAVTDSSSMAVDSTPLFEAIRRREWHECFAFLGNGSSGEYSMTLPAEEQVRTWVTLYRDDGRLLWRRLPIHEALYRGAPSDLIYTLLQLHPLSVETRDSEGNLPLHLAMANNAERVVIEMIIQEYPLAMEATNENGKLPLECVNNYNRTERAISPLRGEVLQSYVSSAKEVASQQVPRLKDKLFEVNRTIEAAKSELRLAKVELSMIKQQERMRLQNKEKEESRMKEEVMRLRSELESLRNQQEQLSSEKEQWAEKAKLKEQRATINESKSDSEDSQRSWIAMEFSEMVSELEQSTKEARERQAARERQLEPSSSYRHQSRESNSWTSTAPRSTFRDELDSFKKAHEFDIKETRTEATESTQDYSGEMASIDIEEREPSRDSGDSHASIRSIREQLEQSRKRLGSRSNSEDRDDHNDEQSQQSAGHRNRQYDDHVSRDPSGRLVALDARLSDVLFNTFNDHARDDDDRLDGVISERGSTGSEERNSYLFKHNPNAVDGTPLFQSSGSEGRSSTRGSSDTASNKSTRFSLSTDNEELQGDIEAFSEVLDHIPKSALASGPDETPTSNVLCNPSCKEETDVQERLSGVVSDKEEDVDGATSTSHDDNGSVVSSSKSDSSQNGIGVLQNKTNPSELEKGLALLSPANSSVRWNCTSMADDLTRDDDGEDEGDEGDDEEETESDDVTLNENALFGSGALDPVRQELFMSTKTEFLADGSKNVTADAGPYEMVGRRGQVVSFAEETTVYEENRDDFSPQFSRFDDVVDRAMSRIAVKTTTANSRSRSQRRSHSRSGKSRHGVRSSKHKEMRHICVTGEDKVEILSSNLQVVHEHHVRSSASISGASVNSIAELSEAGYNSEM